MFTLARLLDKKISSEELSTWKHCSVDEILKKHPKLDYQQLENEAFKKTDEGKKLLSAYEYVSGTILARILLEKYGNTDLDPIIPLSKSPIIEALIISRLTSNEFWPKAELVFDDIYDIEKIIWQSDSALAHEALTKLIITKPLKGLDTMFPDVLVKKDELMTYFISIEMLETPKDERC